ncbi:hypothetical protein BaRGS_00027766 [Batillaria attramentaria]|uniref:Enhancer of polycomb-like protein n=1 Tax=Batillaria attramentaria TaxID=370345 RepID=A0ABD0K0T8_9CAEN
MSKVSFRARALDVSKPMPIYRAEEIPDLRDYDKINRAVLQMPTGMEKEEETETHLQNALTAQQFYGTAEARAIPIPEVQDVDERYTKLYSADYKPSKQYIHIQALGMEQEIPDYDLDSEDETWLTEQTKKMEITPIKFEEMMDRLEKGSGQQVVTLQEAKLLLKEDDDLIIAVYDYWLNKRLRLEMPLIPQVKSEKRDGTTTNNPYVAFRRRTEKMQTRKNRKNDEVSYEKMLKLKRDLSKAVTLLELIKRREKSKKEMVQLSIEILEKRYQMEDFSGTLLAEAEAEREKHPFFIPPFTFNSRGQAVAAFNGEEVAPVRKKRHSDDDLLSPAMSPSDHEDENDPDGPYAFKRRRNCSYYAPLTNRLGNWPWCDPEEGGLGDQRNRFSLTTLPGGRCIGFARRRVGRGGRVIFDRAFTPWDEELHKVDLMGQPHSGRLGEYITYVREQKFPFFRPQTPPLEDDELRDDPRLTVAGMAGTSSSPSIPEFNLESFQCHREQLMQMQREQEARLLNQDLAGPSINGNDVGNPGNNLQHSFSSQPTSRFTLDSASAEFAVSAVINASDLSTNAMKIDKNTGLSTSPAASVLQLNFPITTATAPRVVSSPAATAIPSPAPSPSAASTLPVGSSGNVMTALPLGKMVVNNKVLPQGVGASGLCGLPTSSSSRDILK